MIVLRGGTYHLAQTLVIEFSNSGKAGSPIRLTNYKNETVILDFSRQPTHPKMRGIQLKADYWIIEGLTLQRAGDNGIYLSGSHNIIRRVTTRFNRDSGIQLGPVNTNFIAPVEPKNASIKA